MIATAPVVLKAIRTADYRYPVAVAPSQTNPDGVTFDRVAHLDTLRSPEVTSWVSAKAGDGIHIMAAFALGAERGQVEPWADNAKRIEVSLADLAVIRQEARAELDEHS
jgi:hypothetical protein